MKTIVFAVAGYNLAETGRHIEIARVCKDLFNIIFKIYKVSIFTVSTFSTA